MVAKRLRFGNAQLPIYALTGYTLAVALMVVDQAATRGDFGRLGVVLFLAGAVIHILDKFDRLVGQVWDAGGRAERRRAEVAAVAPPDELAAVRSIAPRP